MQTWITGYFCIVLATAEVNPQIILPPVRALSLTSITLGVRTDYEPVCRLNVIKGDTQRTISQLKATPT